MTHPRSSTGSIELLRGLKYLAGITDDPNALKIAFDRPVTAQHRSALVEAINTFGGVAQAGRMRGGDWAQLLTLHDVMKSAYSKGGDRLMSVWERDLNAIEAAILAMSSTDREGK